MKQKRCAQCGGLIEKNYVPNPLYKELCNFCNKICLFSDILFNKARASEYVNQVLLEVQNGKRQ